MIPPNQDRYDRMKRLSVLLDSRFKGPLGTSFGLDGLLGLIPGLGDIVTTAMSCFIIFHAYLLGCGPSTLARMALNVLLENLIDTIPLLGNVFDFFWKANSKNMQLVDQHLQDPQGLTLQSRVVLGAVLCSILAMITASIYATWWLFSKILMLINLATS